eukprot:1149127-Pelagomonas_calceolata.AAC.2
MLSILSLLPCTEMMVCRCLLQARLSDCEVTYLLYTHRYAIAMTPPTMPSSRSGATSTLRSSTAGSAAAWEASFLTTSMSE